MSGEALERALELVRCRSLRERCEGVAQLAALPGERATRALAELLEEPSWYVRERVAAALRARPEATPALLELLSRGSWFARASACEALHPEAGREGVCALLAVLEDRNVSVQRAAVEALGRLRESLGEGVIARALAALPPARRRRVRTRLGHRSPRWALRLEEALRDLPPGCFGPAPQGGTDRAGLPPLPGADAEVEAIAAFRRWLAALPLPERSGRGPEGGRAGSAREP